MKEQPQQLRVRSLRIESFRGIPGTMDFSMERPKTGECVSVILSGDNGTGKSSVVDALEYALQGTAFRRASGMKTLQGKSGHRVTATLSDDSIVSRGPSAIPPVALSPESMPHPQFSGSPFVLRRGDIMRFWSTPEHKRQLMFLDYMRDLQAVVADQAEPPAVDEATLESRRVAAKSERRKVRDELAKLLGVNDVPMKGPNLVVFVRDVVLHGRTMGEFEEFKRAGGIVPGHVPEALVLVEKLRRYNRQLDAIDQSAQRSRLSPESDSTKLRKAGIREILAGVSSHITAAFRSISASRTFVKNIKVLQQEPTEVSVAVRVELTNGRVVPPEDVFSEANLDLLALLMFLAFIKEAASRGNAKLLVLDDVFQSVDSVIRVLVVEQVVTELHDWQMLFTVHDRLWLEQLRGILRVNHHPYVDREILRWDFSTGPVMTSSTGKLDAALRQELAAGSPAGVCMQAGVLLERICNSLSCTLPISVVRCKGDRYTLGDLWPGVLKQLSKSDLSSVVASVERWVNLRNIAGAHFNEWALSLSAHEASNFAAAVIEFLQRVWCDKCYGWIERRAAAYGEAKWSCRCGETQVASARPVGED